MDKVAIKNISTATVVLSVPELKFRRELVPGRTITVSKEDYDELVFDPGINGLINDHYILISGAEDDAPKDKPVKIFDKDELEQMLDKQDVTAFAKMIPTAAQAEKETLVQLAIDKGITHPGFVKLMKQYCGVDIIEGINRKHQMED